MAPRLETARLVLRPAREGDAGALARFHTENRERFEPLFPSVPAGYYTEAYWCERIAAHAAEAEADRALRLCVFRKEAPAAVIGVANFSAILRGPAQYCNLGYALAASWEGQGVMREALETAIAYVFGELRLHRVQANYMPRNARSGTLLKRLGFEVEGLAKDYLLINGRWEDHVLTSLTNPAWRAES